MADKKEKDNDAAAKAKSVRASRFKLGSHYAMERFCATFLVFVAALGLIVSSSIYQKVQSGKITLTEQAIYGEKRTGFSLTQDEVYIDGLWSNDSHTKAFIMLHLPGGLMNLSSKAEDYEMFMTGVSGELNGYPSGSIYVFGSIGYIGLGFTNSAGFEPAAYKVTLRNISYLGDGNKDAAIAAHDGKEGSYAYHNEVNIIANFAASGANKAEFYEKADYTAVDIYKELVQSSLIQDKIKACDKFVSDINTSMAKANEYARRLEDAGISVEEYLPAEIYGDEISIEPHPDMPKCFDSGAMMYASSGKLDSVNGWYNYVNTSSDKAYPEGSKLYYNTDYVFPGGLNYDYQDVTANTDLLSELVPADMTYIQFMDYLKEQEKTYSVSSGVKFGNYIDSRNGMIFQKNSDMNDLVSADVQTNINNYESALSDIFSKKRTLQMTTLKELLRFYYDSSSMNDITSVYMGENTLTIY